jgi:hypothetical protein
LRRPVRALAAAVALAGLSGTAHAPAESPPLLEPVDGSELAAHAIDVVDYTLRATLDASAHMVHGRGSIRWTNTSRVGVRELWLHLYLNAFKNDRSVFLRERVGGRGSSAPDDWGWIEVRSLALREAGGAHVDLLPAMETKQGADDDETEARVPLPREVVAGETITLDVEFDDKLPTVVERTGYRGSFHMVGQWFPKIARLEPDGTWAHFPFHHLAEFYADFGTYDVTLDVPDSFTIGATGPVAETRVEGGRRVERHVQGDIHDFAWTAWDLWRVRRERIDGVDVSVLYPPGFEQVAARDLGAVRFALPYEGARYGRYPYSVLTVVHPQLDAGEAGGMEYPTLITAAGPWWTPRGVFVPESVTVHELGHQWFYGLVATNEVLWPMLDEGINEFAEVDAMARWKGAGSAAMLFGLSLGDAEIQAVTSAGAAHDEPVAQPAYAFSTGANYGNLVYGRTAAILTTLARVYGDEAVGRALGRYARRFRFLHPVPSDLVEAFTEVVGEEAAATLRTALFDKGWVDYAVDTAWSERTAAPRGVFGQATPKPPASEWEGSVIVRRRGTLTLPVDVDLLLDDGTTHREHWDGKGDWLRIPWHGSVALRGAVVDPERRVLVDERLSNNETAVRGEGGGASRAFERATYWAELALQALSP